MNIQIFGNLLFLVAIFGHVICFFIAFFRQYLAWRKAPRTIAWPVRPNNLGCRIICFLSVPLRSLRLILPSLFRVLGTKNTG
jgi:hypothetical protein